MATTERTPEPQSLKVIYTKIVGDLFHPGHVAFLREARALGDRLVVHVVDDDRVARFKRAPIMTQEERLAVVACCRWVDEARAQGPRQIDRAFMDHEGFAIYAFAWVDEGEREQKLRDCADLPRSRIAMLSYTPGISTTMLLGRIAERLGSLRVGVEGAP
jgi:cytidyltransferase-like protein